MAAGAAEEGRGTEERPEASDAPEKISYSNLRTLSGEDCVPQV